MIGSMADITNQKLAEDALVNSEKNYRLLFNNAPLAQFIYDMETLQLLEVNEAAVLKYGYSREEALTMKVYDFRPKEEHENVPIYINTLKEQNTTIRVMAKHILKNGEKITVEINVCNILYKDRLCVLGTIYDLTEKISLEEKLTNQTEINDKLITDTTITGQQEEREQIVKELSESINHILNTTSQYLETALSDEPANKEMIEKSRHYISCSMNELQSLSRLMLPSTYKNLSIGEGLNELVSFYKQKGKFRINFKQTGSLKELSGNIKTTILHIAHEQLNNICRHAFSKNVSVKLSIAEFIILSVKDDGVGFDTSHKHMGNGMKYMTNQARLFKGKLSIISRVGQGCTLTLRIPLNTLTEES
jgi:PAS domain S-box-containing protein